MAASSPRPDPASPASIAGASFDTARKGYDTQRVGDFLKAVSQEMTRLIEANRQLEREAAELRQRVRNMPDELDEATVTRLLGEEAAKILSAAREAAQQTRARADEAAARVVREATDEATRLREAAELDAARRRSDAAADAESELEMAKQQGREMVEEARAYRERVLSELARRRDLARQQIEQLEHGRDRLLDAFQRARAAADEVVVEVGALQSATDEDFDLRPTTGPVPVTPTARPPEPEAEAAGPEAAEVELVELVDEVEAEAVGGSTAEPEAPAEIYDVEHEAPSEPVIPTSEGFVVVEGVAPLEDTTVIAMPERDSSGDEPPGEGPVAPVVSLFAGEVDRVSGEPRDEVGDIFAKLRAASAETVAREANASAGGVAVAEVTAAEAAAQDAEAALEVDADSPFARRDEVLVPLIVGIGRKLKRVLADEQNEVLDALRRSRKVRGVDDILPALAEQVARYRASIDAELRSAALAGAKSLSEQSERSLRATIDKSAALANLAGAIEADVVAPLRERVERSVEQSGGDPDDLATLVRGIYREWKTQRIDEVVDDLAHTAYGNGAYAVLAPGTSVCWLVDPHGPPCPDAEDNALAGATPCGDAFPTGHSHPPVHAGCRCLLGNAPQ